MNFVEALQKLTDDNFIRIKGQKDFAIGLKNGMLASFPSLNGGDTRVCISIQDYLSEWEIISNLFPD